MRTVAVDADGRPRHFAYREFPQHFPRPGWVEHDPDDIWGAVQATLTDVVAALDGETVAGIGITDQRETVVVWDRATGRPRHRAIVWQDRRTASRCDDLRVAGVEPLIRERTGLVLDPYFSATKLEWLLREGGVDADADLAFGTVDSWVLWNLGAGVHATEPSNASRTMLFDIDRGAWSDELLELFGVPRSCLPEVRPSSGRFGITDPDRAAGLARAGLGHRRRSAGRVVRPGVLLPRHDQEHLRHRLVRARQPGRLAPAPRRRPAHHGGVAARRGHDLRHGGVDLRHRRRGAMAARRARHHRRVVGSRTARRERARPRRRRVRARVHGARLAVLRPVRARRGVRAHARARPARTSCVRSSRRWRGRPPT